MLEISRYSSKNFVKKPGLVNVLDMVADMVPKLALSVFVAVWIRESGLEPPTHVRANNKPVASRAPPKGLTSQARIGQVRLVTLHTRTSLTHWNPSPAGLASQTRTCMGTLREMRECTIQLYDDTHLSLVGLPRLKEEIVPKFRHIVSSHNSCAVHRKVDFANIV